MTKKSSADLNERFIRRLTEKAGRTITLSGISFSDHPDKTRRQVQGLQQRKAAALRAATESLNLPGTFEVWTSSTPVSARLDGRFVPVQFTRTDEWLTARTNKVLAAGRSVSIYALGGSNFKPEAKDRLLQMTRELNAFAALTGAPVEFTMSWTKRSGSITGRPVVKDTRG